MFFYYICEREVEREYVRARVSGIFYKNSLILSILVRPIIHAYMYE